MVDIEGNNDGRGRGSLAGKGDSADREGKGDGSDAGSATSLVSAGQYGSWKSYSALEVPAGGSWSSALLSLEPPAPSFDDDDRETGGGRVVVFVVVFVVVADALFSGTTRLATLLTVSVIVEVSVDCGSVEDAAASCAGPSSF